jgi:hypothetical protein
MEKKEVKEKKEIKEIKYLENKFCDFELLSEIDTKIKKNMFIMSLFRMKSGGYKNFFNYLNGIRRLNSVAEKKNMEIRIFIDSTIYSDEKTMQFLKKLNRVTLVLYKCSDFLIDKHHVGLFGTLVRFFPLFNFPNNDANVSFIVDADIVDRFLDIQFKIYEEIEKNNLSKKIYFAYSGNFFHVNMSSNKKIIHNDKKYIFPYCIAGVTVGFKKIKKKPFENFIERLKKYMNKNTIPEKILTNYYISPDKYKIKCENNICFGVDEYFLNKILFKFLLKKEKPFCYFNTFDMASFNFYKNPDSPELRKNKNINHNDYRNIFNDYMKKIGLENYSYNELDKKIYIETKYEKKMIATPFMKDFADGIIYLMNFEKKEKKYDIFNKYDYYYLNEVDYKKYYKVEYIRFININMDDIYISKVSYE